MFTLCDATFRSSTKSTFLLPHFLFIECTPNPLYLERGLQVPLFCTQQYSVKIFTIVLNLIHYQDSFYHASLYNTSYNEHIALKMQFNNYIFKAIKIVKIPLPSLRKCPVVEYISNNASFVFTKLIVHHVVLCSLFFTSLVLYSLKTIHHIPSILPVSEKCLSFTQSIINIIRFLIH